MITEDNTSAPNDIQLTAMVEAADASTQESYEIAAEHRHHADAILAMDVVNDVPPPYEIKGGWGAGLSLRSEALPPEMAREVKSKLAALGHLTPEQRNAKEAEFTAAAIRSKRAEVRLLTGVGKDATPFHREMVGIAREVHDLYAKFDRISDELADIDRHETRVNPETGEKEAVPVYRVAGTRADAYIKEQQAILSHIRLLVKDGRYGIEGKRRMDEALYESVAQRVVLQEQVEDRAEAKARARRNERERRINQQAEILGRMSRNEA